MNPDRPKSNPLLRPRDQTSVAVLAASALVLLAAAWWRHGGLRGELVDIDRAPPLVAKFQVDVNHADWPELIQLPGVGQVLAERLIAERQRDGEFRSIDDLEAGPRHRPRAHWSASAFSAANSHGPGMGEPLTNGDLGSEGLAWSRLLWDGVAPFLVIAGALFAGCCFPDTPLSASCSPCWRQSRHSSCGPTWGDVISRSAPIIGGNRRCFSSAIIMLTLLDCVLILFRLDPGIAQAEDWRVWFCMFGMYVAMMLAAFFPRADYRSQSGAAGVATD